MNSVEKKKYKLSNIVNAYKINFDKIKFIRRL